jgi:hypothetical protein
MEDFFSEKQKEALTEAVAKYPRDAFIIQQVGQFQWNHILAS